jgi:hypothetical protein
MVKAMLSKVASRDWQTTHSTRTIRCSWPAAMPPTSRIAPYSSDWWYSRAWSDKWRHMLRSGEEAGRRRGGCSRMTCRRCTKSKTGMRYSQLHTCSGVRRARVRRGAVRKGDRRGTLPGQ